MQAKDIEEEVRCRNIEPLETVSVQNRTTKEEDRNEHVRGFRETSYLTPWEDAGEKGIMWSTFAELETFSEKEEGGNTLTQMMSKRKGRR